MKGGVGSRIWRETDTGVMRAAPHIECPHSVSNMMRIMMTIVMMMMMMMMMMITCDDGDDDDDDDYV